MKKLYLCIWLFFAVSFSAQTLKPSIGLTSLPPDASTICPATTYTGSFSASGFQAGDTIPHFKLYDVNGAATDVLTLLQTGKPLLLIGGNYTCPVYRQKVAKINQVAATYSNQLNIFVVYAIEAHPKTPDVSPYSGTVWTTSENQNEGILYLQPTTYGVRKQMVSDMLANPLYTLSVPVLIDGPCNAWWQNFGPAPNNAYLIKPDGTIYKKHAWFDKSPDNINTDINALLVSLGVASGGMESAMVSPNPVADAVTISLSSPTDFDLTIRDLSGREVFSETFYQTSSYQIDMKDFPQGLYIFNIRGVNLSAQGKLIKSKQ